MKFRYACAATVSLALLAACDSPAEKEAAAVENSVAQQAAATGGGAVAPAALGLSETQLLDADLVGADGADLGDIQQTRRDAAGNVDGFVVEIENSDPDRYVFVPLAGLTTVVRGDDTDIQTSMTAADLARLPDTMAAR